MSPKGAVESRPAQPPDSFGEGSGLDRIGSVSAEDAESAAGSID